MTNTTTLRHQAVSFVRVDKGHYTIKNIAGQTLTFKLMRDVHNYINANWGQALIEAQF